jgi:hypothetical protein
VHDLVLVRDLDRAFLRLIAGAFDGAPGSRPREERAAVVVAELHDHEIAGLQPGQHAVPQVLGLVGSAAAAAAGNVHDIDLHVVKVIAYPIAPADLAAGPILHGGVADHVERRHVRHRVLCRGWPMCKREYREAGCNRFVNHRSLRSRRVMHSR